MPSEPHVLDTHRAAIRHLKRADPRLARVIDLIVERVGPFNIQPSAHAGPFEALLRSIFYQQLNGKAAASILGRFKDRFGAGQMPSPATILAASTRQLRSVGLSRQKIAAIRDLSQKALDGTVPPQAEIELLSNEEIIERLTVVRGSRARYRRLDRRDAPDFSFGTPKHPAGLGFWSAKRFSVGVRKKKDADSERAGRARRALAPVSHRSQLVFVARLGTSAPEEREAHAARQSKCDQKNQIEET
jgi:hypothetical protein